MYSQPFLRKVLTFTPVTFILESIMMGVLLILLFGPHVKRWGVFAAWCAGLGLIMTIVVKIVAIRSIRSLGLTNVRQVWALKDALDSNEPPTDKVLVDALPAYLARGGEQIDKLRRDYRKSLVMFGGLAILSILTHMVWSIVFILFISLTIYVHNGLDKKEDKIQLFCSTLEGQGIKIVSKIEAIQKKREKPNKKPKGWSIPS